MGWLIALAVIVGLAILPLGVRGMYDSGGPRLWLLRGPARIALFPTPKREKTKSKPQKKQPQAKPKTDGEKQGGSFSDFLPIVKVVLDFLGDFRRKLRLDCDFTESKSQVWGLVDLTIPLCRLLSLLIRHGRTGLGEFMKLRKRRKGGAL